MSLESPSNLVVRSVPLTPKSDKNGVRVKLKVFWKTTRFWTEADIIDFQRSVPAIAERLRSEQYWNKYGEINRNKFTCEDFAVRVLCEYASSKELPVKLTTGVRTYRNMEMYSSGEHDRYASNMYGFSEMIMLSFGAPDMQRTGVNTVAVARPEALLSGDVLAKAYDRKNAIAHHIQIVIRTEHNTIHIMQGNTSGVIVRPFTTIMRLAGANAADPQNKNYAGKIPEVGMYKKAHAGWNYKNNTTGREEIDFLKLFQLYRWNFTEFNR